MLRFLHWRSLFRRHKFEGEMADEFAFHVQSRTDDLIRAGSPRGQEAKRRAHLEFGGKERYRAECRESHRLHWLDELGRNIRYALRSLRRTPTFSGAAINLCSRLGSASTPLSSASSIRSSYARSLSAIRLASPSSNPLRSALFRFRIIRSFATATSLSAAWWVTASVS